MYVYFPIYFMHFAKWIYGYFVTVFIVVVVVVVVSPLIVSPVARFAPSAFQQKFVYKKRNIYAIKAKLAMNAARVLLLLAPATKVAIKLLAFCKVFAFDASTLLHAPLLLEPSDLPRVPRPAQYQLLFMGKIVQFAGSLGCIVCS